MKDIMLRIIGRQINRKNEVEEDSVEFMTEGKLYKKNDSTYIVYEETEMSGLEGVTTTLRIDNVSGDIRMKRYGNGVILDTVMEFKKGRRFSSLYDTPYGSVPMEVLTNKIVNDLKPDEGKGNLFIDYEISLKGLSESRSLLNIEVSPTQM
jgi:uncharacterized beta-barrel protein YwiB (DUF1934 family)